MRAMKDKQREKIINEALNVIGDKEYLNVPLEEPKKKKKTFGKKNEDDDRKGIIYQSFKAASEYSEYVFTDELSKAIATVSTILPKTYETPDKMCFHCVSDVHNGRKFKLFDIAYPYMLDKQERDYRGIYIVSELSPAINGEGLICEKLLDSNGVNIETDFRLNDLLFKNIFNTGNKEFDENFKCSAMQQIEIMNWLHLERQERIEALCSYLDGTSVNIWIRGDEIHISLSCNELLFTKMGDYKDAKELTPYIKAELAKVYMVLDILNI